MGFSMRLQFEPSEIARFGRKMARLKVDAGRAPFAVSEIISLCEAEQVEMLAVRVPTELVGLVQELEDAKFRLMDCLVYYEVELHKIDSSTPKVFEMREAMSSDVEEICEVAKRCFAEYFSHYHADARLDRSKVAEGYIDWARRSCLDKNVAATVLLPVVKGQVAGFATMRQNSPSEGEGVLFGVHPTYSGLGIYGTLIDRGKQWCREKGMSKMIVSTQLENRKVQTAWTNRGFRQYGSYYTFHRWFV